MAKRTKLPKDIALQAGKFYDGAGYMIRFETAYFEAQKNPQVFNILGKEMVKVVFKAGTYRKGYIFIMSDGKLVRDTRDNRDAYYEPATQKYYSEFISTVPADAHKDIVKMVLDEGNNSFESIVSTMSSRLARNIPENITEQIITGYALEQIPEWFNTPVKGIVKLKDQPYCSGDELGRVIQNAFNHWALINKENVFNMDFNGETVFTMMRKYLTYKKLEGLK